MLDLVTLGGRVHRARHGLGLTLQQPADAAEVSVSVLSSVERGQKAPTAVVLARVAEVWVSRSRNWWPSRGIFV